MKQASFLLSNSPSGWWGWAFTTISSISAVQCVLLFFLLALPCNMNKRWSPRWHYSGLCAGGFWGRKTPGKETPCSSLPVHTKVKGLYGILFPFFFPCRLPKEALLPEKERGLNGKQLSCRKGSKPRLMQLCEHGQGESSPDWQSLQLFCLGGLLGVLLLLPLQFGMSLLTLIINL